MLNDYYQTYFSANVNQNISSLQQAIMEKRERFTFTNCSVEEIQRCVYIASLEIPLLYNVFLNESTITSDGTMTIKYHDYDEELLYEKLNLVQSELQQLIPYDASSYEIVKYIYDYITTNYTYDKDALNKSFDIDMNDKSQVQEFNEKYGTNFSLYGPLVNKKGVCSGLCQLFRYLLNSFGIEAVCIAGFMKRNGETTEIGHSVVLVEIDGQQAFIDIANGMKNISNLNMVLYNSFMVGYDDITEGFEPMFSEYNFDFVTDELTYFKKYDLEFPDVDKLAGYLNSIIDNSKEIKVYAKYTGRIYKKSQLEKLVNDIVTRKMGHRYQRRINVLKNIINVRMFQGKEE